MSDQSSIAQPSTPAAQPSKPAEAKLHPATTVSNIKNFIPITLEIESSQYASWATLFTIHCKAFLVHDHLLPRPIDTEASSSSTSLTEWERLDAIILQWIYSTISNDLLHTVIDKTATAHAAWKAIEDLFQDNKSARAINLLNKFSNTRLDNFPNVTSYCQELKVLADQLANVDAPVSNDRLVLQLIAGLNDQYEGIGTILTSQEPLPNFYKARSKIVEVESRKAEQALHNSKNSTTVLTTSTTRQPQTNPPSDSRSDTNPYRGRGRTRGRGRGRGQFGRGRSNSYYPSFYYPPPPMWPWPNPTSLNSPQHQTSYPFPWPAPPCPYPNRSTPRPNGQNLSSGILGSKPSQAHHAYTPTDIEQAMYTMSLQQPDPTLYMDTGATSTMDPEPTSQVQQQR